MLNGAAEHLHTAFKHAGLLLGVAIAPQRDRPMLFAEQEDPTHGAATCPGSPPEGSLHLQPVPPASTSLVPLAALPAPEP